MSHQESKTCVFYDGACPLCRREINHYKTLNARHADQNEIDWIDISQSQEELTVEGIAYEDAMQLIHVKDDRGVHQVGLQGIFTLWDKLPLYRKFSQVLKRIPLIHTSLDKAYLLFAKNRTKITGRFGHD